MKKLWAIIPAVGLCLGHALPVMADTDISVVAIPNPIGIPEVIIVAVLLVVALWQKGWVRMLLSVCIIIWGAFFIPYDVKMAAPLLAVGSVIFFQAVLVEWKKVKAARESAG